MLPELFHTHHSRNLEDLPLWLELAAQMGDPILELGCGTGRLLLPLAQAGYRIVGLDHDLRMLNFLHDRIDSYVPSKPSLIVADITCFQLAMQFALILLPCNTFSTLNMNQRRACLGCVRRHLKARGMFAVSLPNPQLLNHLPAQSDIEIEGEFILPRTGNPVQVSSSWQRTKDNFIVTWNYDHLFPDGTVERVTAETIHQRTPVDTYMDDIQSAGFEVKTLYGDFDHSAYTAGSPSLIILATG